ncbi:hypothetical protein BH23PLA1_BH23PLA1_32330 [soil metagenome]
MRPTLRRPVALLVLLALPWIGADDEPEPLRLTEPIVCLKIVGYDRYEARPEPALTSDEKLLIYIEPLNHTIVRDEESGRFRAHLTQSARVRRQGQKRVLWEQEDLGDYKPESDHPPRTLYLSSTIALKGLPLGDYEIDITYQDRLREGAEATRTVEFRIIPAPPGADPE